MNKVILIGRLTKDPDVRYSQGQNQTAIARYSIAVPRRFKRDGEPDCDFINCVSFGKTAEFAQKYFYKGIKIAVVGHIQTGSYADKNGNKVYTTDVIVDEQEFCENKNTGQANAAESKLKSAPDDGFMLIPDSLQEELPFH